jgi:hypothetical protein
VADCRWLADKKLVDVRDMARGRRRGRRRMAKFTRSTRFVLTAAGVAFAAQLSSSKGQPLAAYTNGARHRNRASGSVVKPRWDSRLLVLHVDDIAVKEFEAKARNQLAIVAAFEAQDWPRLIENPLDSGSQAQRAQALADAVHALNRNLRAKVIRFHTAEKGACVRYDLLR